MKRLDRERTAGGGVPAARPFCDRCTGAGNVISTIARLRGRGYNGDGQGLGGGPGYVARL
jgi:hypothetical protein